MDGWKLSKIPKIAHFYWGSDKLPFLRYVSIISFARQNPTWKTKVYVPFVVCTARPWKTGEHSGTNYNGPDYFPDLIAEPNVEVLRLDTEKLGIPNESSEVHKSDVSRLFLLAAEGGLWSDTDILYFRPMDMFYLNIEQNADMDLGVCVHHRHHYIGFYFCAPRSPFFGTVFKEVSEKVNLKHYQAAGAAFLNGQFQSIDVVQAKFSDLKVSNILMETVYPYSWTTIKNAYGSPDLKFVTDKKRCIGVHWFGGDENSVKYGNVATADDYGAGTHVISRLISMTMKNRRPA